MTKRARREIARDGDAREGPSAVPRSRETLHLPVGKPDPDVATVIPPCPVCHRIDRVQRDAQTANGVELFACARCSTLYPAPPRR